jgi:hypothetical protein
MGKLQPNFSWQKYEGNPEDQKEQFQYQLQQQHVVVANSVNATIDDESYFNRARMTSFTWTDGQAIWTKTITGTITTSPMTVAHGIPIIYQLVRLYGTAQDAQPVSVFGFPLPFLDLVSANNGIEIYIDPTNINLVSPNNTWVGYQFSVTIEYTIKGA